MATTTVLTRGSDWSEITLNDGWGECGDERADECKTYEMLGAKVSNRFDDLCEERGIHAYWYPYTSEVIGNINQNIEEGLLDELRVKARTEIWDAWCNGEIDPILRDEEEE